MTGHIEHILTTLKQGKQLVAATIMSSNGSTPRTSGSKMLIFKDGSITGTIGGMRGLLNDHDRNAVDRSRRSIHPFGCRHSGGVCPACRKKRPGINSGEIEFKIAILKRHLHISVVSQIGENDNDIVPLDNYKAPFIPKGERRTPL